MERHIGYVRYLQENVDALSKEAEALESKRKDIEREGEEASRNRQRLTNQAKNWLMEARNIETDINSIKSECQNPTRNMIDEYDLGKRAVEMLEVVKDFNGKPDFIHVANNSPERVLEMPNTSTHDGQSTFEQTLEEIWGHVHDERSSIICVYGMGGIGKTTLMKAINNRLSHTHDFEIVIWVTISKDFHLERIQKEIGDRLELKFNDNHNSLTRSTQLHDCLKKKRYMLILDDLWEGINLDELGIPKPNGQNKSKIAITTRLVDVYNDMEGDVKIKVNPLTKLESWNLFLDKAGEVVLRSDIQPSAEEVAKECGGLPLAITTVGRAMRGMKTKEVWENALRALRAAAPEIRGMDSKVFLPLKFSYDHLEDDDIKKCFLSCSLYPEDYEIKIEELVRYWVMEGFIDKVDKFVDATNKGYAIIERIKAACLLEEVERRRVGDRIVKMHDMIRDLAVWITSSSCSSDQVLKLMIRAGIGLKEPPKEMWRDAERISLVRNSITNLPLKPNCPNLVSLLMSKNPIREVPSSFFELMPKLQILDLSYTVIESLAMTSSSLLNLRALVLNNCQKLKEVALLGQLKELQFLDLSYSGIKILPQDIGNLDKLRVLKLRDLSEATITIPRNVISSLCSLEELDLKYTKINWGKEDSIGGATLSEVTNLKHLTTLRISFYDFDYAAGDVFNPQWSDLRKFYISILSKD